MYESGDLRKGLKIEINGEPNIIIQFNFVKPGKGKAFYKKKIPLSKLFCLLASNFFDPHLVFGLDRGDKRA